VLAPRQLFELIADPADETSGPRWGVVPSDELLYKSPVATHSTLCTYGPPARSTDVASALAPRAKLDELARHDSGEECLDDVA